MNTLAFHNTQFDIVDRDGQPWLQAVQIAKALGYAVKVETQGSVGAQNTLTAEEYMS